MMKPLLFLAAISVLMLLVPLVWGSGARMDWSDKYDDIAGAPECWVDGYDDGQDNPFSQDKHKECLFDVEQSDSELCCNGRPYYEGFMYGCMDAGNTQETCDRFTDWPKMMVNYAWNTEEICAADRW